MNLNTTNKKRFYCSSEYGELLDLALYLQNIEGHEVVFSTPEKDYAKIGEGLVKKDENWWNYLDGSWIFLVDGCGRGAWQDWLRKKGVPVFGGNEKADKLENDRQMGQQLFKSAGFIQPVSKNFTKIEEAIKFVEKNKDKRYILKQNGDAPKFLSHMGKFENNEDMIYHLETLQKRWTESQFGKIDFDLMEVVEGLEVAASAFFNGTDWMRDKEGKAVAYLNFEEKKENDGGMGETTGETGTTFMGTDEDNQMVKDILFRPKITEALKAINYKGVFDINCIKTKEGIVALEPTCRFGIPGTSYEFLEGLASPIGELIESVAKGENKPIEIKKGVGMVIVLTAKPFPVEFDLDDEGTSIGEKLWILKDGKPTDEFSPEQLKHIHLENFYRSETGYHVATKNGYLLVVSGNEGKTIAEVRKNLTKYIKDNLYIFGMKFRTDIGKRVEEYYGTADKEVSKKEYDKKFKELEEKHQKEIGDIKNAIKKTIYE